jgi:hypothetical protein
MNAILPRDVKFVRGWLRITKVPPAGGRPAVAM